MAGGSHETPNSACKGERVVRRDIPEEELSQLRFKDEQKLVRGRKNVSGQGKRMCEGPEKKHCFVGTTERGPL